MANSAASLNLISLDYDQIANNFTQFAAGLPEFSGYDFNAGGLASIVKLLAYNTWLNSFFTNMAISESFLDTAQLEASVFSHAKELNYVPRSATSASAQIQMTWQGASPVYTISKGQMFTALVRGLGSLMFTVPENIVVVSTNTTFTANLTVYEGTYVADSYTMNYSDPDQRFFITNPNVDTSSVTVAVTTDAALVANVYTQANTLLGLNQSSQVWFLQAAETGQFEVVFGDGVVGFRPNDGSTVIIDYRITKGTDGNGAKTFAPAFNPSPGNATGLVINTLAISSGGGNVESTDSVRFYAPRYFQIQQRAVSADDYAIMLRNQFPEILDAYAYGGETITPPQYNKVFVSVDLNGIDGLPDSKVQTYTSFLSARCPLTTVPVIVAPIDQFIGVQSNVIFDASITTLGASDIQNEVVAAMQAFANTNLGLFNSNLRYSRFVAAIDDSDPSIISNQTSYYVYQKVPVIQGGTAENYAVTYNFPIMQANVDPTLPPVTVEEYNVWTGPFVLNGQQVFLADDGLGNVKLVLTQRGKLVYSTNFGTVNYTSGLVSLQNFAPNAFNGSTLRVYVRPASLDLVSPQNTVLNLGDEINVQVTSD